MVYLRHTPPYQIPHYTWKIFKTNTGGSRFISQNEFLSSILLAFSKGPPLKERGTSTSCMICYQTNFIAQNYHLKNHFQFSFFLLFFGFLRVLETWLLCSFCARPGTSWPRHFQFSKTHARS